MVMMCRGFRGATTASENTKEAINAATEEMLRTLVENNDLNPDSIAAAYFTLTPDLNAEYPASVARRRLGWNHVALMDEINTSLEIYSTKIAKLEKKFTNPDKFTDSGQLMAAGEQYQQLKSEEQLLMDEWESMSLEAEALDGELQALNLD